MIALQVGSELTFAPMDVVAGAPAGVEVSSEANELLNSGVDKTVVSAKVVDKYNNPVQEGAPVSWNITYSGNLERSDLAVDGNGTVTAEYRSGLETLPTDITLTAGDVESKVTIYKKTLDYTLAISANSFTRVHRNSNSYPDSGAPVGCRCYLEQLRRGYLRTGIGLEYRGTGAVSH